LIYFYALNLQVLPSLYQYSNTIGNHISQLMGHEDSTMALTVYSGGLRIEPLVESINKLSYEEVDSYIKETLEN